ncbi:MAG TPA: N-formylglutamate amidohydrolase, partial [Novosphingobium sp.]|nr:N-formylglutamate amidohydrolase [Novosphingobium sp.]
MIERPGESDSQQERGGRIPGVPGAAAFVLDARDASEIPIVIAAPHGGRVYPPFLLRDFRHGESALMRLEDRHVDALAKEVAALTGASLLLA